MLRGRGVLDLDYVAVTHGDPDHIGGAGSLLRDFQPREIWWGVPVPNHAPTGVLFAESARTRATWRWLQRGDRLEIGGVEIRVHHPPLPDWERQKVRNNDSLVLELRYGNVSVLLTGDIDTMARLVTAAPGIRTVTVGGVHHKAGRLPRSRYVFLTPDEEARLQALAASGVTVVAQDVPQAAATPLDVMLRGEGPT